MTRVAFLQCGAGVSGDMLLGALLDLGLDRKVLEERLRRLPLPGLCLTSEEVRRGGVRGRTFVPSFEGKEPVFRTLGQVAEALRKSGLGDEITRRAEGIFRRIAAAEAAAHGKSAGTVHFHELAGADTLVDVVGVLIGWRELGIGEAWASPVNVGGGEVETAHGTFPVPPPATAHLLAGWPVFGDGDGGEKTTPTGAALVTSLCRPAAGMPRLTLEGTGRGAGAREFASRPNLLQVLIGRRDEETEVEEAVVLETNLDDLNPQIVGYLGPLLLKEGAFDVYVTPVVMKKGRPGHLLTVVCPEERLRHLGEAVVRETGTLGYRFRRVGRVKLRRGEEVVRVDGAPVRVKTAALGGETVRFAPEYEDCRRIAERTGRPLRDVIEEAARSKPAGEGEPEAAP